MVNATINNDNGFIVVSNKYPAEKYCGIRRTVDNTDSQHCRLLFCARLRILGKSWICTDLLLVCVCVCVCMYYVLPGSFQGMGKFYFKVENTRDILDIALLTKNNRT